MKRLFVLILLFINVIAHAQEKIVSSVINDRCTHDESTHYYDWPAVEKSFAGRLNISEKKARDFFVYAFTNGYVKMSDYFTGVKEGNITPANAQHYWLSKLSSFEAVYKGAYQNQLISEKQSGSNQVMTSCNNLDFGNGTLSNWSGEWNNLGTSGNIVNQGVVQGYGNLTMTGFYTGGTNDVEYVHEICTAGNDPNIPISRIPPGHNYSLRLGNDSALRQNTWNVTNSALLPFHHQTITNTFLVTPANKTIIYWYAVVLTQSAISPHPQSMQPYFQIRMYDQAGNEITCAHYDVDATTASSIGGFQTAANPTGNNQILYKDWSQVLIPLVNYMGQNVTISFETSDCAGGGHSGYAYLAVDCAPFAGITAVNNTCNGTQTLTAPAGLSSYSWTGPGIVGSSSGQSISVNAAGSYSVTMTTMGNSGFTCTLSLDTLIGIPPPPPAIASFTNTTVCVGGSPTQFTDASTLNGYTVTGWNWNFGDGGTSTQHNPSHTYAAAGTYTVSYTITTSQGCTATHSASITVNPLPVASFSVPSACEGTTVYVTNTSSGGNSWNWNFGDGSPNSAVQAPNHIYANAGTYNITYTVTATGGCSSTYTVPITVNPSPGVSFTATDVCQGNPTVFTSTTNGVSVYNWGMGDGNGSSTQANPVYTYAAAGTYTATLNVYNIYNCTNHASYAVVVHPTPVISFAPSVSCQGMPTTFTNNSTPSGGVNYTWDFGDGSVTSSVQSPSHTYNSLATYTVSLAMSSVFGCSSSGTHTVTVQPIPSLTAASPAAVCSGVVVPSPSYTVNPSSGVTFTWNNSNTLVGLAANGNGMPPAFTSASNTTSSNITGTISLLPDLNGCTGSPATVNITVKPTPVISHSNVEYCPSVLSPAIGLSATPAVPAANISWTNTTPSVSNGLSTNSGTGNIPAFTTLNASDTAQTNVFSIQASLNGCTGPATIFSLTVNPFPSANFTYPTACVGNSMLFSDSSTIGSGTINAWGWDMDNNGTYTDTSVQNPAWTFTTSGNLVVGLLVTSNKGCKDSISKTIYVNPSPVIDFSGDSAGCSPYTTQLTGTAYVPWPQYIQTWSWDAGNGNYFTGTGLTNSIRDSIVATYSNSSATQPATFSPVFQVVTNLGCMSTFIKTDFITVYPQPVAGFTWYPEKPDIINPEVTFTSQATGASGLNAYNWYFGDVFATEDSTNYNFTDANPVHAYSDQVPYTYEIIQAIQNEFGCRDTAIKTITIVDTWTFYIPNAFTPHNHDGKNDGFKGTGIGIDNSTYTMWIFDRWGNMIFHSTGLEEEWDGTLNGEKVQEDTYVWRVEFEDLGHHEPHEFNGVVSVIR